MGWVQYRVSVLWLGFGLAVTTATACANGQSTPDTESVSVPTDSSGKQGTPSPSGSSSGANAGGSDGGTTTQPVIVKTSIIDVTLSGCTPAAIADDGIDDAPAFACAIARAAQAGGEVYVPAGKFDIGTTLVLPPRVTLRGAGFGTVLRQPHRLLGPVVRMQNNTVLSDLELDQEQPTPGPGWMPNADYDYQVRVEGDRSTLSNLMLLNPYLGVSIAPPTADGAIGQIFVSNLRGQPLKQGLHIDHALDVIHIQEVHFWPFWSARDEVLAFTLDNGIAIDSLRNDNPLLGKLFFFGYKNGIHFGASAGTATTGVTSKPKITELDCDLCQVGIYIDGSGTRGVLVSQFSVQNPTGEFGSRPSGHALMVGADGVTVAISQGDFASIGWNAVRVVGANVLVSVDQTFVREWNRSGSGFPAFEIYMNPTSVLAVTNSYYGEGHGGQVVGGGATATNVVPFAL